MLARYWLVAFAEAMAIRSIESEERRRWWWQKGRLSDGNDAQCAAATSKMKIIRTDNY